MISQLQTHIHSFLLLLTFASMHSQQDCVFYSSVLTVFKFQLLLEALYRKLDIFSDSFVVDLFIPLVYRYGVTTIWFPSSGCKCQRSEHASWQLTGQNWPHKHKCLVAFGFLLFIKWEKTEKDSNILIS